MSESRRGPRSDAIRNRALLLDAAEREFAAKGMDVSVAEITARAGLGKGTFFRHFPTKDALLAEVIATHLRVLEERGRQLITASDAGDALLTFLVEAISQKQESDIEFLIRASMTVPSLAPLRDQFFATVTNLVTRAQGSGSIRADITGADVVLLMCAPGHIAQYAPGAPPDLWKRYLYLIFDGLRPDGAGPLPTSNSHALATGA